MTIIVAFKKPQMGGQGDVKRLLFKHGGHGEIEPQHLYKSWAWRGGVCL